MNVTTTKLDQKEFLATLEGLKSKGVRAEVVTKAEMQDATITPVTPALSNAIQLQRDKMQTPKSTSTLKRS